MKLKKQSVFYKYLISYLMMFLLPILVVGSCFYVVSVHNLSDKNDETYSRKLMQVVSDTQNQFTRMSETAVLLYGNPIMRFDDFPALPHSAKIEVIDELEKQKQNDLFSRDIIYYPRGKDYLITPSGMAEKSVYFNRTMQLAKEDGVALADKLNETNTSRLLVFDTVKGKYVLNVVAPGHYNRSTDALFIFPFFLSDMQERFDLLTNELDATVALYSKDYKIGEFYQSAPKGADRLLASHLDGEADKGTERSGSFIRITATSENGRYRGVLVVYKTLFSENINQFRSMFLLLLILLLIFGFVVGENLAYRNFKPIKRIEKSLKAAKRANGAAEEPGAASNEIEAIQELAHTMIEENITFSEVVEEQNDLLFHHVLLGLLNGDSHLPGMDQLAYAENTGEYYFVMAVRVGQGQAVGALDGVHRAAEGYTARGAALYCVETNDPYTLAILCAVPFSGAEETEKLVRGFAKMIQAPGLALGVGGTADSLSGINLSYIEALAALKCGSSNEAGILFYGKLFSKTDSVWYPSGELIKLSEGIEMGNFPMVKTCVEDILEKAGQTPQTVLFRRTICFEMVNIVIKSIAELGLGLSAEEAGRIAAMDDMEDCRRHLLGFLERVCAEVRRVQEEKTSHVAGDVVAYINAHCCDYDIGLKKLSETFGLSVNYLTILLNERLGQPFREYIIRLRMGKARELLEQTGKTVGEISELVGYANPSHFIKMFKEYTSMTPAQYRKATK